MTYATPRGFRDILPHEALARERIIETVRSCFSSHGYQPVETPILEDRGVIETAARLQDSPFQLFDKDDRILMLRPDLTLPICRMVASRMGADELPVRLRYVAPVVREQGALRGQARQFTQLGVELIGGEGTSSEAAVAPLLALLSVCGQGERFSDEVFALVHKSDFVGLDELVHATEGLEPAHARALTELVRLCGDETVVGRLEELLQDAGVPDVEEVTANLRTLCANCSALVRQKRLRFDFSILNNFDYYTGLVFKAYAEGMADSLASGGHYDAVLANLGLPDVAACFLLGIRSS